jgi:hypothetical protein
MEETHNQVEAGSIKKKKKFVYLEKYEAYKEAADARMNSLERSLNVGFVAIGILVVWIILLTIKH